MSMYDVIVIGAGPAGCHVASLLAQGGKRVAIADRQMPGGVCVHIGCIPTKVLVHAAEQVRTCGAAEARAHKTWQDIKEEIAEQIQSNEEGMRMVLASRGVHYYQGEARLDQLQRVETCWHIPVDGEDEDHQAMSYMLEAADVILATGSHAHLPEALAQCPEQSILEKIIDIDHFWSLDQLPKRLAIIGGGITGCELACSLKPWVSSILLVEAAEDILGGFSKKQRTLVREYMARQGIEVMTSANLDDAALRQHITAQADLILLACGREPQDDAAQMPAEAMAQEAHMYRIGDAHPTYGMTAYGAKYHAECLAEQLLAASSEAQATPQLEPVLPRCAFTTPPLASIGYTAEDARACGLEVREGTAPYYALGLAKIQDETDGFLTLVRDVQRDQLIGAQIAGGPTMELIGTLQICMQTQMPASDLRKMVFAHPIYSEAIRIALDETYSGSVELPKKRDKRKRKGV